MAIKATPVIDIYRRTDFLLLVCSPNSSPLIGRNYITDMNSIKVNGTLQILCFFQVGTCMKKLRQL